jgi:hypothetical protein
MSTALDIMTDSLQEIGVYAPGETLSDADQELSFSVLNVMLDEWASESIFVYQLVATTFATIANQQTYTIGLSGSPTITAARPQKIAYGPDGASITIASTTTQINVVSAIEYQSLAGYTPSAGTPDTLWYNAVYPAGILTLLPTPNAVGTVTFQAWSPLLAFATLETEYALATGFYEAVRDNLAVLLKSYFTNTEIDKDVGLKAVTSKDWVRFQSLVSRATLDRFRPGPRENNKTNAP